MPNVAPSPGIALALSGGGFRATLFHLGSLWRLNEMGWLPRLKVITSVSGGSITAGYLGIRWKAFDFDKQGIAVNFEETIVKPVRRFCRDNYDVWAGALGMLPGVSGGDVVARGYRKHLFGDATLQELPDEASAPRFILYATSLQTGASVRFSKTFLRDYKVGRIDNPTVAMSKVVAASSAFPPVLSTVNVEVNPGDWSREEGNVYHDEPDLKKKLVLTDGGVYDNMGLEAVFDRYETVLVSDAGAPFDLDRSPSGAWLSIGTRALLIASEQTRALRKRWLIKDYKAGVRKGSYWGIATHINDYDLSDAMTQDSDQTAHLARVRTRLNKFEDVEQEQLINWGYALTDAAMRRHVSPQTPRGAWPCSSRAL